MSEETKKYLLKIGKWRNSKEQNSKSGGNPIFITVLVMKVNKKLRRRIPEMEARSEASSKRLIHELKTAAIEPIDSEKIPRETKKKKRQKPSNGKDKITQPLLEKK